MSERCDADDIDMDEYEYPQFCCACAHTKPSRNLIMLDRRGPTPGKGWGCVICALPWDGALAALCDECVEKWQKGETEIGFVFEGYVKEGTVISICALPLVPHEHDLELHPEVE